MIDSIDFRVADDGKQVEVGFFEGEECVQALPLDLEEAQYLQTTLAEALRAIGQSPDSASEKQA